MQKLKFWIISGIVLLIVGLIGFTIYQSKKIQRLEEEYSNAVNNNKAYEQENLGLKNKAIVFKETISQLEYSKDSITNILNKARKDLKIKDSQIKELQHIASTNAKKDTIRLVDTIFANNFALDTTIADEWAKLQLTLEYPNLITADYSFKNSTSVITSVKRETIDPPKKCWLARLFQKKQSIVVVDIVQDNPYCTTDKTKHIEIVSGK